MLPAQLTDLYYTTSVLEGVITLNLQIYLRYIYAMQQKCACAMLHLYVTGVRIRLVFHTCMLERETGTVLLHI